MTNSPNMVVRGQPSVRCIPGNVGVKLLNYTKFICTMISETLINYLKIEVGSILKWYIVVIHDEHCNLMLHVKWINLCPRVQLHALPFRARGSILSFMILSVSYLPFSI